MQQKKTNDLLLDNATKSLDKWLDGTEAEKAPALFQPARARHPQTNGQHQQQEDNTRDATRGQTSFCWYKYNAVDKEQPQQWR